MCSPQMVMLDEPTAGVNPTLAAQLLEYMLRTPTRTGMTFLLIEHDMEIVMNVSDRVIVMSAGRVIAEGRPDAVRRDTAVIDAYLGTHAGPPRVTTRGAALSEDDGEPILETDDLVAGYGEVNILHGVSIAVPPQRVRVGDRAERGRQVDVAEGHLRDRAAARRHGHVPPGRAGARHHREAAASPDRSRAQLRAAGRQRLPEPVDPGEPRDRVVPAAVRPRRATSIAS